MKYRIGSHNVAPAKAALAAVAEESPGFNYLHHIYIQFALDHILYSSTAVEVSPADVEIVIQDLGKVGVIIAGDIAKDEITEALVKALVVEGVSASSISLSYVSDSGVLPYSALTLAKTVNLVIAASAMTHDPKGSCQYFVSAKFA